MLKVVENELAIRRYQRQFVRSLKPLADETIPVKLGHMGASMKARVAWSESLGIWFFSRKIAGSRYWHAFGIGRPEGGAGTAITSEINFPFCGIDRRTGGAFAQDHKGRAYVVHRGKLGGGRKGIGKSLFEDHYRGIWEIMDDGSEETPVAVIGLLNSPRFARQVAQFVRKIARIKDAAADRSFQTELTFDELCVREELIGTRYREQERQIGAECDQGLIVGDLAAALKKSGIRSGNDGHCDLIATDSKGRIRAIFQVRTAMALPGLHTGAMQLLLNGLPLPHNPLRLLILPQSPDDTLREKLKRLNIDLLTFDWRGDRAIFPDLDALIARIAL